MPVNCLTISARWAFGTRKHQSSYRDGIHGFHRIGRSGEYFRGGRCCAGKGNVGGRCRLFAANGPVNGTLCAAAQPLIQSLCTTHPAE